MPLVALEAMEAGVPVVATRVIGSAEAVDDGVTGRSYGPVTRRRPVPRSRGCSPTPGSAAGRGPRRGAGTGPGSPGSAWPAGTAAGYESVPAGAEVTA